MFRGAREVANFARRISRTLNLPKNAAKPGWKDMTTGEMIQKLHEEYSELRYELAKLHTVNGYTTTYELNNIKRRIAEEATDLGAVCVMITDNVGGLKDD